MTVPEAEVIMYIAFMLASTIYICSFILSQMKKDE